MKGVLVFLCGYVSLSLVGAPEPDSLDELDPRFLAGFAPKSLGCASLGYGSLGCGSLGCRSLGCGSLGCGFGARFLAGLEARFLGQSLALSNVTPRGGTFPRCSPPLPLTPSSAHTMRGARA